MHNLHSIEGDDLPSFSFSATLHGAATIITTVRADDGYRVFNNGKYIGKVKFGDDGFTWILMEGEIVAPEFIQEIGERIESHYL